jgi:hypothetical protein
MTTDQVHTNPILKYDRTSPNIIREIRSMKNRWAEVWHAMGEQKCIEGSGGEA